MADQNSLKLNWYCYLMVKKFNISIVRRTQNGERENYVYDGQKCSPVIYKNLCETSRSPREIYNKYAAETMFSSQ